MQQESKDRIAEDIEAKARGVLLFLLFAFQTVMLLNAIFGWWDFDGGSKEQEVAAAPPPVVDIPHPDCLYEAKAKSDSAISQVMVSRVCRPHHEFATGERIRATFRWSEVSQVPDLSCVADLRIYGDAFAFCGVPTDFRLADLPVTVVVEVPGGQISGKIVGFTSDEYWPLDRWEPRPTRGLTGRTPAIRDTNDPACIFDAAVLAGRVSVTISTARRCNMLAQGDADVVRVTVHWSKAGLGADDVCEAQMTGGNARCFVGVDMRTANTTGQVEVPVSIQVAGGYYETSFLTLPYLAATPRVSGPASVPEHPLDYVDASCAYRASAFADRTYITLSVDRLCESPIPAHLGERIRAHVQWPGGPTKSCLGNFAGDSATCVVPVGDDQPGWPLALEVEVPGGVHRGRLSGYGTVPVPLNLPEPRDTYGLTNRQPPLVDPQAPGCVIDASVRGAPNGVTITGRYRCEGTFTGLMDVFAITLAFSQVGLGEDEHCGAALLNGRAICSVLLSQEMPAGVEVPVSVQTRAGRYLTSFLTVP
jgi:hypothetical protein